MSWAADNPEVYDAIEQAAVVEKLKESLKDEGFNGMDEDTIKAIVETLQAQTSGPTINNAWHHLMCWAHKELSDAEADYFASKGDN